MPVFPFDFLHLSLEWIRENIDPEGVCTENELWDALHKCHLAEIVEKQDNKLDEMLLMDESFTRTGSEAAALSGACVASQAKDPFAGRGDERDGRRDGRCGSECAQHALFLHDGDCGGASDRYDYRL